MKETLSDIVRRVSPHFEYAKIVGTETTTKIDAFTGNKLFFLAAVLKNPIPEFLGEFGLGNLTLLKGLLEFPSYKSEDAKFSVQRALLEGNETVSEFEFKDRTGAGTRFRTMTLRMMEIDGVDYGKSAKIAQIDWDLSFQPSKAKVTELTQLAGLLSEVNKSFGLKIDNENLYMTIGAGPGKVTHSSTICLMEGVDAKLIVGNSYVFDTVNFMTILKKMPENNKAVVNISSRGVIGITVETDHGFYTYYLRGSQP